MRLSLACVACVLCFLSAGAQDKYPVTRLTSDLAQEGFASWSADGTFLVHSLFSWKDPLGKNGIWKIVIDRNVASQVFAGIAEHPAMSPDGRLIVFDADTGSSIRLIATGGGLAQEFLPDSIVIRSGGLPCWSPSGSQIAFKESPTSSLCVCDLKSGSVVRIFHAQGFLPLPGCWSRDGQTILFALMNRETRKSTMWRISADGKQREQIRGHHEGFYRYIALSPDGSLLVYAAMEGNDLGLWVMPAEGGTSLPLAITHPGHNESPAWSPDGKHLAFTSTRSGNFDIWLMHVDLEELKGELDELQQPGGGSE